MSLPIAATSELSSWLASHGARQSSALVWPWVGPRGRGVGASRAAAPDEVLLRVPASQILTSDRAQHFLAAALPQLREAFEDNDEFSLTTLLIAIVAVASHDKQKGGAVSGFIAELRHFLPFVSSLPRRHELCCLICEWQPAELELLGDEHIQRAATESQATSISLFKTLQAVVSEAVSGDDDTLAGVLRSSMSWGLFCWARNCVISRTFVCGLDMPSLFVNNGIADMLPLAIVPLGDMFNHWVPPVPPGVVSIVRAAAAAATDATATPAHAHPGEDPRVQPIVLCEADWEPPTDVGAKDNGGFYLLRAAGDSGVGATMGAEMCISYGDRSGRDLLENYGFIIGFPENAHESVTADVSFLVAASLGRPSLAEAHAAPITTADEDLVSQAELLLQSAGQEKLGSRGVSARVKRAAWDEMCSPTTIDLPCAAKPDADSLALLRLLAIDDADCDALHREAHGTTCARCGSGAGMLPPPLPAERLAHPISRANEIRVLHALRLVASAALSSTLRASECAGIRAGIEASPVHLASASVHNAVPTGIAASGIECDIRRLARCFSIEIKLQKHFAVTIRRDGEGSASYHSPPWLDFPKDPPDNSWQRMQCASLYREARFAVGILVLEYVRSMFAAAGIV